MEKQADKQRKTHGKTTNHTNNKDKQQNNTKKLLSTNRLVSLTKLDDYPTDWN